MTGRGRRTTVNRPARALGGQAGGTAARAARRVRAPRGRAARRPPAAGLGRWLGAAQRATGRVGRPFDAAPPGLNRGAGLVPGAQVAGRRRRRRRAATGRPGKLGLACRRKLEKGQQSQPSCSVPISTFARFCRSLGAISSIRRWLLGYTLQSGKLGPGDGGRTP